MIKAPLKPLDPPRNNNQFAISKNFKIINLYSVSKLQTEEEEEEEADGGALRQSILFYNSHQGDDRKV